MKNLTIFHQTSKCNGKIFGWGIEFERSLVSYGCYGISSSEKFMKNQYKSQCVNGLPNLWKMDWFWQCVKATMAWEVAFTFLFHLRSQPDINYRWKVLNIEQYMFKKRLLHSLKKFDDLWSLLKGIILWYIWIDRNDLVFTSAGCHRKRIERAIWEGLLDLGLLEWQHTMKMVKIHLEDEGRISRRFDQVWCPHHVICLGAQNKVVLYSAHW